MVHQISTIDCVFRERNSQTLRRLTQQEQKEQHREIPNCIDYRFGPPQIPESKDLFFTDRNNVQLTIGLRQARRNWRRTKNMIVRGLKTEIVQ